MGLTCAMCLAGAGCGDTLVNSGAAHPGKSRDRTAPPAGLPSTDSSESSSPAVIENPASTTSKQPAGDAAGAGVADPNAPAIVDPAAEDPARPRKFVAEGPNEALRIGFDDLDLMKLINMDPVTSDCVEKMPEWLRDLNGKQVRIRGYMKPSGLAEGIPEFVFVRSTDLCCFGPKGKVYHLIAVRLKPGTTTDYIELKPFDVAGKFRIEKIELDDGLIFLLYHIDDATIIRK
ncbi:MAG TPA: hypothetical protein VGM05_00380 [Planctomycetaceae bacterium]